MNDLVRGYALDDALLRTSQYQVEHRRRRDGVSGQWGFRADVRYFRALNNDVTNATGLTTGSGSQTGPNGVFGSVLPGLDFWRANVGLAFRW